VAPTKHRAHKPHEHGPRLEQRGRYWTADLRPWQGQRYTALRDPQDPAWPHAGERTEDRDTAARWGWEYVALHRGEARARAYGVGQPRRLGEALAAYSEHRERTVSEQTRKVQAAALRELLERFGPQKLVHQIGPQDVQSMLDELHEADYKPNTLLSNANALSGFFRWVGGPNPAASLQLPDVATPDEPYAWADADIQALRDKAERSPVDVRLMLELGLACGVRLNEALALRWSDFDPDSKTVRISRQMQPGTRRIVVLKSKQARTALVLPFFWPHYPPTAAGLCIADAAGKPLTSNVVYKPVVRALQAAGVHGPQRGYHDARRTYGRLFLEMGGWMDELQRSLGHSTIRITERAYGRFQAAVAAQFARQRIYGEGRARRLL
jgi:integrase